MIEYLYKYGMLNCYSKQLFTKSQIWLSRPKELNDPFECRPYFDFSHRTKQDIIQSLERDIKKNNPQYSDEECNSQALRIYNEGRHRHPSTWQDIGQKFIMDISENIGIFCLSSKSDNILMWSHYSDCHRGYCLIFEASDIIGRAMEVSYSYNHPVIDYFNTSKIERTKMVFLTKYKDWSYEKEFRLIDHEKGPGLLEYPKELLKGIIFGLRMPAGDKEKIRNWTIERQYPVKFYETVQNDRQFKIDIKPID